MRYAEFVVPLVKSVQELSQKNLELSVQNQEMMTRILALEDAVAALRQ